MALCDTLRQQLPDDLSSFPVSLVLGEAFRVACPSAYLHSSSGPALVREEIIERSISAEREKANARTFEEMVFPSQRSVPGREDL
jgi:hypothetical protein